MEGECKIIDCVNKRLDQGNFRRVSGVEEGFVKGKKSSNKGRPILIRHI